MKVFVIKSFASRIDNKIYQGVTGHTIDMPDGADWIEAGLVKPVDNSEKPKRRGRPKKENAASAKAAGRSKRGE